MENEVTTEKDNMSVNAPKKGQKKTKAIIAAVIAVLVIAAICVGVYSGNKSEAAKIDAVKVAIEDGFRSYADESFLYHAHFCLAYDSLSDKQKEKYNDEIVEYLISYTEQSHGDMLGATETNALRKISERRLALYKGLEDIAATLNITKDEHLDFLQYLDAVQDLEKYIKYCDAEAYVQSAEWDLTQGINKMAEAYQAQSSNYNLAKSYFEQALEKLDKNITSNIMVDSIERDFLRNVQAWKAFADNVCSGGNFSVDDFNLLRLNYVDIDEKLKSISKEAYNDIINLPDFYM